MKINHPHDPFTGYKELTLRGIILGILITIVFTASNIYLGLKVGLTFASSIPAAVLSMAVLKFAKDSNILENNQVQTQASAAGTLSSVVFVIPGLLMMGYWADFPFWQTTMICLAGGILGVIFTIPLRRVMVVNSPLPYPEGVAAAEILKAGATGRVANEHGEIIQDENQALPRQNVKEILYAGVFAAIASFFSAALRLISDSYSIWFKSGAAVFQIPFGFSLALLGAGSLIGIAAGIAILVGISFTWGIAVPILSTMTPMPEHMSVAAFGKQVWTEKVRMMGVGVIGIASIWTLISLFKPMLEGIRLSIAAYRGKDQSQRLSRADRDLRPTQMLWIIIASTVILFCSFYDFVSASGLPSLWAWGIVAIVTLLTLVIGFLVAAACGYMAGLVGSSSSPISGIGILSVLAFSVVLLLLGNMQGLTANPDGIQFLTALTLFAGTAVLAIATISNDNLQDLKTGYLVHATPAKQQISLIIGCIAGALVISPVLQLLYQAYGFSGALPRASMDPSQALAAPQALLMTTIAQGIFSHQLLWDFILMGVGLGIGLIIFDLLLRRGSNDKYSMPVLAVGLGIYLPPAVNIPLFFGAMLFWLIQRHIKASNSADQAQRLKTVEQRGTLLAAGFIVGESIMGVILAMIIVFSISSGGSDAPLAIHLSNWENIANILGALVFIGAMYFFAQRCLKR